MFTNPATCRGWKRVYNGFKPALERAGCPIVSSYDDDDEEEDGGDIIEEDETEEDELLPHIYWLFIDPRTGMNAVLEQTVEFGETAIPPTIGNVPAVEGICPALTFTGWNHTPAELMNVQQDLVIGAEYMPTDGKTHLFVSVRPTTGTNPTDALTQVLNITVSGAGASIEWGDGLTDNVTSSNAYSHTYASYGEYEVKITANGINNVGLGRNSTTTTTWGGSVSQKRASIIGMYVGANTYVAGYTAYNNDSIRTIVFPYNPSNVLNSNTIYGQSSLNILSLPRGSLTASFAQCTSLNYVSIPNTVTSVLVMTNCYMLKRLVFPLSVTSFTAGLSNTYSIKEIAFHEGFVNFSPSSGNMFSLANLVFPTTITTINSLSISSAMNLRSIVVKATSPPTLGSSNVPVNPITCIYVPDASLTAYKTATNWSALADYIYPISDVM